MLFFRTDNRSSENHPIREPSGLFAIRHSRRRAALAGTGSRWWKTTASACLGAISLFSTTGQGSYFTVLNTGGQTSPVSDSYLVSLLPPVSEPVLEFRFGFGTDESFRSGTFHDSFTISLQDTGQAFTAVYLTIDASGLVVAPATPGTAFLDPTDIRLTASSYPDLQPPLAYQYAYAFSAPIPTEFVGTEFRVFFDLFDNQDGITSQGWFSEPKVVPEPDMIGLVIGGLLLGLCIWRFKRQK